MFYWVSFVEILNSNDIELGALEGKVFYTPELTAQLFSVLCCLYIHVSATGSVIRYHHKNRQRKVICWYLSHILYQERDIFLWYRVYALCRRRLRLNATDNRVSSPKILVKDSNIHWCAFLSFLSAFAKLRKATISFVISVRPSVSPHGTTRLWLGEFWWNLIFFFFENLSVKFKFFKL